MHAIAPDLFLLEFPHRILGTRIGRRVTVIRLRSGELVIHSTAPFSPEDLRAIESLGRPAWIVEATRFHDTFARVGRAAFPEARYLAPQGPRDLAGIASDPILPAPPEWSEEIAVLEMEGIPGLREHLFLHRPSRTLIVADLVFNFGPSSTAWTRWFFRWVSGIRRSPGMSRIFLAQIRDRNAFRESARRILEWDFDRLIPAHGDVIESGAKPLLERALADAGCL